MQAVRELTAMSAPVDCVDKAPAVNSGILPTELGTELRVVAGGLRPPTITIAAIAPGEATLRAVRSCPSEGDSTAWVRLRSKAVSAVDRAIGSRYDAHS